MMRTLHGYTIDDTQWEVLGGGGECNKTAEKDGSRYFIKRVSSPVYPSKFDEGTFRSDRIKQCEQWMQERQAISASLPGKGRGNLVKPLEYFLDGVRYYEVTYLIDVDSISLKDVWKLSAKEKRLMMLTVSSVISEMHESGIVHGDLDPNNILISHAFNGKLITKLIDFTNAFFESSPPESIMSKEPWWSPEVMLYEKNGEDARDFISSKMDVFSLGIIFHQYCTRDGAFPPCSKDYPWQDLCGGANPKIRLNHEIEPEFQDVISHMLEADPSDRPTMREVWHRLRYGRWLTRSAPSVKELSPGSGKTPDGRTVVKVWELTPRKVRVKFNDGQEIPYDRSFAKALGYFIE